VALLNVIAKIAYVPGSMQKRCHLSVYLMKSRRETRSLVRLSIVRILHERWFEREQ
jgi:hypothetical protein